MEQILAALKEMEDRINARFDRVDQELTELRYAIKMTQQAVFDTSDRLTASVQDLEHRLDAHRVKFTRIEEDLHILKEKQ